MSAFLMSNYINFFMVYGFHVCKLNHIALDKYKQCSLIKQVFQPSKLRQSKIFCYSIKSGLIQIT